MNDSSSQSPDEVPCFECGAMVHQSASHCWMCKAILLEDPDPESSSEIESIPAQSSPGALHGTQFRLSTLMLTATMIAVFLGVARMHLGLGIVMAILVTPAMIRAALASRKRRGQGSPMNIEESFAAFIGSLGVVIAVSVASGVAFYATCWIGFFGGAAVGEIAGAGGYGALGWGFIFGVVVGIIVGITTGVLLLRKLWPFRSEATKKTTNY